MIVCSDVDKSWFIANQSIDGKTVIRYKDEYSKSDL